MTSRGELVVNKYQNFFLTIRDMTSRGELDRSISIKTSNDQGYD